MKSVATVVAIVLAGALAGCVGAPDTVLEQLTESRRLSADLLVQFTKATDAANRAVMADTDEASNTFAREAERAALSVQSDAAVLAPILASLRYSAEADVLKEFTKRFDEYRTLDRSILELAVENTNLKAQRLSFGPAQEAADAFRDALQGVSPSSASNAARLDALIATAIASLREVQVLQAPHIAESDDAVMTRLETRMDAALASARAALTSMGSLVQPASKSKVATAAAALDQFKAIHTQIIGLSRRNSNVRSLALSLGQKRTLTAACEESLHALQDALAKRGFAATR